MSPGWCLLKGKSCEMNKTSIVDKVPVSRGWRPVGTERWHNIIMYFSKSSLSNAKIMSLKSTVNSLPIGG